MNEEKGQEGRGRDKGKDRGKNKGKEEKVMEAEKIEEKQQTATVDEEIPEDPTVDKGRKTRMNIGDGKRDDFSNLLNEFEKNSKDSIDSYQEPGAREIHVASVFSDARSGLACTTDENGIPHLVVTGSAPGVKNKKIRQRFFMGMQTEIVAKSRAIRSISLNIRKAPRPFDIIHHVGNLLKTTIPNAQDASDKIQRKIDEQSYEHFPVHLTPPEENTVAEDTEPDPDLKMIKDLVSFAYGETANKLGGKANTIKVELIKLTEHILYADSLGSKTDIVYPRASFTLLVNTKDGNEAFGIIRGSGGTIQECLSRYVEKDAPKAEHELKAVISKLVDSVVEDAIDLDRAQSTSVIGASKCPVILSPQVGGVMAHEIFGHPSEADIICENRRTSDVGVQLKSRIGSQVSDYPFFSMIDTPDKELKFEGKTISRYNWGALPVDGYGNKGKTVDLIKNGTMVGALIDRHTLNEIIHGLRDPESIKETGVTGNVRREKFDQENLIRMRTTCILPDKNGPASKEEMAKLVPMTKKGLYVKTCNGGAVDTNSGDFWLNANLCYLIENGIITQKPVKGVVITGNIKQIGLIKSIGNIETMGDTFAGWCGKNGQNVPVDGGSPIIYIEFAKLEGKSGGLISRSWTELVKDYILQHHEVVEGKRGTESINIPEFRDMAKRGPQNKICLATAILPENNELRYLMGIDDFSTHEISEKGKLIEKKDKHE